MPYSYHLIFISTDTLSFKNHSSNNSSQSQAAHSPSLVMFRTCLREKHDLTGNPKERKGLTLHSMA